jgi:predicted alpha-1,6-mannanase (GH76 family)
MIPINLLLSIRAVLCPSSRKLVKVCMMLALPVAVTEPVKAFTNGDADTIVNAFNNAFYNGNGGNGFFKDRKTGGDTGFWTQAEMIEGIEDANDRTGGAYATMITSLLNGFSSQRGTNWSSNNFNDDIAWACIAYLRGYQATGNANFRSIAKTNFDLMYSRAWNTSFRGGGLWWKSPQNASKNSAVEGPAAIAAYMLYQTLNDTGYLTKSQNIFNWQKANLYNSNTGQVYDAVDSNNVYNYWASSYNQGTFIQAANLLGDVTNAKKAANYMISAMGDFNQSSGYRTVPQYGLASDLSAFNGIGMRWLARFMKDRGLQSEYQPYLTMNANLAWNNRRTSDNLSWCLSAQQTPGNDYSAWECLNGMVALQVAPAGDTPNRPYYFLVNRSTGKSIDVVGGGTGDGTAVTQWDYNYTNPNHRFTLAPTINGDHTEIVSWLSGKAVSIAGDSTADGAQVHIWGFYDGNNPSQQWDFIDAGGGWFKLKNLRSGKMLDLENGTTANGGKVQQYVDNNALSQQWRLQPWGDYNVKTSSNRYVCIAGGGSGNGSAIIQYDLQNVPWFKWRFEPVGGGLLKASSLNALGRVICPIGGSTASAASSHLWDYNAANVGDQKIRIKPLNNGKVKLYFSHTNMSWDVPQGQNGNNAPLTQYPDNGNGNQQFNLERVQ